MRFQAVFEAFIRCLLSRKNLKTETKNCLAYSILVFDVIVLVNIMPHTRMSFWPAFSDNFRSLRECKARFPGTHILRIDYIDYLR